MVCVDRPAMGSDSNPEVIPGRIYLSVAWHERKQEQQMREAEHEMREEEVV